MKTRKSSFNSLDEAFNALAALENFDKKAFVEDQEVSQNICNFVLALAVIHCDLKNANLLYEVLLASAPSSPPKTSKEWGEFSGLKWYLTKIMMSLVHELFNLIEKGGEILKDPFFEKIILQLSQEHRRSWNHLVKANLQKKGSDEPTNILLMIRNKVAFHYDPKEIFSGYQSCFLASDKEPFISRGHTLLGSRLYFADAAAEAYSLRKIKIGSSENFFNSLNKYMDDLNIALFAIVQAFIQKRGFAWKKYRED